MDTKVSKAAKKAERVRQRSSSNLPATGADAKLHCQRPYSYNAPVQPCIRCCRVSCR